jgi:hypothetical protein
VNRNSSELAEVIQNAESIGLHDRKNIARRIFKPRNRRSVPAHDSFLIRLEARLIDSRLSDDDNDPALLAALREAVAYADAHPGEAKSIDEVCAVIPQWISESRSKSRQ